MILLLLACAPEPTSAETFDAVWDDFDALYGPFEQRGVDWDAAYDRWRPEADADLWTALTGLFAELDDGHVMLAAPDHELFESNRVYREHVDDASFDVEAVRGYVSDAVEGEGYLYGRLGDGISYVWLPWIADNLVVVDEVLDAWPDADVLVVDLRHSAGGDFTWAFTGFGRLTAEDVPVFRSHTRNGPERGSFDAWTTWELRASGEPWDGRVVVITDAYTISASERAAMALQALPGTITVGRPTNGSQATLIGREAPNRWAWSLPVQEVERVDGAVFEGIGLPVDIDVLSAPDELEVGVDRMLEAAIDAAMKGGT